MKTAIVTDSTAYLTDKEIKDNNIKILPIPVIFNGSEPFREGVDITNEQFYDMLRESETLPKTSQPPLGETIELYESLANEGYDSIISIHLSSTISGLLNTISSAVPEIPGVKIYPFDSHITTKVMGNMVLDAADMAKKGMKPEEIIKQLEVIRDTVDEYFIVNDLQNLVKGGRLSNAAAFVGSMLKIKPLLTFDDTSHMIVAFDKVRSFKKAQKKIEGILDNHLKEIDYPIKLEVIHANDPQAALEWKNKLQEKYPNIEIEISPFGPVVGTHLGEKALALAWLKDYDKLLK